MKRRVFVMTAFLEHTHTVEQRSPLHASLEAELLLQSEVPPVAEKFAVEGSLRESGMLLMQHGATQLITAVRMMRDLSLKSLCLRKKLLWECEWYIG